MMSVLAGNIEWLRNDPTQRYQVCENHIPFISHGIVGCGLESGEMLVVLVIDVELRYEILGNFNDILGFYANINDAIDVIVLSVCQKLGR
jgi:hypothetical protein